MLDQPDRDHRKLLDLPAHRVTHRDTIVLTELAAAVTRGGPVIDELVHRPGLQQRAALALMARLTALLATRRILPAPRRAARRIRTGRLRRVTRRALGLALKLRDPLLLALHPRRQRLDLRHKPRVLRRELKQHTDHDLAPLLIDRLGLRALHTTQFDTPKLCPPTH
jgi:hypothetical protein